MASDRPIFLRPVEVVAPLNTGGFHFQFSVNNGGAWSNITIPSGVYASVVTLCYAIEFQLDAAGLAVTARPYAATLAHSFLLKFTGAGTLKIKFDAGVIPETALRKLMGFDSDAPAGWAGTLYAPLNFGNQWYPYRNPSDREGFQSDQKAAFKGVKVAQGQLVGIGVPTVFADRDFEFPMEPVTNVLKQFCTNEYEVARCAETFFLECRTAQVNISTHDNPRGFWFVPDMTVLNNLQLQQMRGVTDGIHFHYTSSPDKWCYGNPPPGGPDFFKVAVSRGQAFYDVNFNMATADVPTFTVSDAIPIPP